MNVTLADTTTGTDVTEEMPTGSTGAFRASAATVNFAIDGSMPLTGLRSAWLRETPIATGALATIETAVSSIEDVVGIHRAVNQDAPLVEV